MIQGGSGMVLMKRMEDAALTTLTSVPALPLDTRNHDRANVDSI